MAYDFTKSLDTINSLFGSLKAKKKAIPGVVSMDTNVAPEMPSSIAGIAPPPDVGSLDSSAGFMDRLGRSWDDGSLSKAFANPATQGLLTTGLSLLAMPPREKPYGTFEPLGIAGLQGVNAMNTAYDRQNQADLKGTDTIIKLLGLDRQDRTLEETIRANKEKEGRPVSVGRGGLAKPDGTVLLPGQPSASSSPFAKVAPKDYTPESVAVFQRTNNPSDLVKANTVTPVPEKKLVDEVFGAGTWDGATPEQRVDYVQNVKTGVKPEDSNRTQDIKNFENLNPTWKGKDATDSAGYSGAFQKYMDKQQQNKINITVEGSKARGAAYANERFYSMYDTKDGKTVKIKGNSINADTAGRYLDPTDPILKADTGSLAKLTKGMDSVNAFEKGATQALDYTLSVAKDFGLGKYPKANTITQLFQYHTGDPKVKGLKNAVTTAATEYMKVINAGSDLTASELSVMGQQRAKEIIESSDNIESLKNSIKIMQREMKISGDKFGAQRREIQGRLKGYGGGVQTQSPVGSDIKSMSNEQLLQELNK